MSNQPNSSDRGYSPALPFDPPLMPDGAQPEPQVRLPASLLRDLIYATLGVVDGLESYIDLPDTELPQTKELCDVLDRLRTHCQSPASIINTAVPVHLFP